MSIDLAPYRAIRTKAHWHNGKDFLGVYVTHDFTSICGPEAEIRHGFHSAPLGEFMTEARMVQAATELADAYVLRALRDPSQHARSQNHAAILVRIGDLLGVDRVERTL